jgi:hypothetical protein
MRGTPAPGSTESMCGSIYLNCSGSFGHAMCIWCSCTLCPPCWSSTKLQSCFSREQQERANKDTLTPRQGRIQIRMQRQHMYETVDSSDVPPKSGTVCVNQQCDSKLARIGCPLQEQLISCHNLR